MRRIYRLLLPLTLLSVSLVGFAKSSFTEGAGAKYKMMTKGNPSPVYLNIYITESSFNKLGVEYYFFANGGLLQMWQQFIMSMSSGGPMKIEEGYVKTREMKKAEKMTKEHFKVNNGVELADFLFKEKKELAKFQVGDKDEKVQLTGFSVDATHYKKRNNGQTIDFWISPKAKPIGLVKLVSSGKQAGQDYTITLEGLLKDVKPTIDPKSAGPLTAEGRKYLASPIK